VRVDVHSVSRRACCRIGVLSPSLVSQSTGCCQQGSSLRARRRTVQSRRRGRAPQRTGGVAGRIAHHIQLLLGSHRTADAHTPDCNERARNTSEPRTVDGDTRTCLTVPLRPDSPLVRLCRSAAPPPRCAASRSLGSRKRNATTRQTLTRGHTAYSDQRRHHQANTRTGWLRQHPHTLRLTASAALSHTLDQHLVLQPGDPDTPSQFQTDTWLTSPVCLAYSLKSISFEAFMPVFAVPLVQWCGWRIVLNQKRSLARRKDQEDVYKLIHGSEMPKLASLGGIEMNDAQNVKVEMFLVVVAVICASVTYFPVQYYAPEWQFFNLEITFAELCLLSVVWPLWISFSISRHHRALLGSGSSVKSAGDRLPHHRPYFTLKYIIRTPHTYSVLVAFLQKEYSSENALFYTEAREFEQASKLLEQRIPTWTARSTKMMTIREVQPAVVFAPSSPHARRSPPPS
jgi:hypothetical protein